MRGDPHCHFRVITPDPIGCTALSREEPGVGPRPALLCTCDSLPVRTIHIDGELRPIGSNQNHPFINRPPFYPQQATYGWGETRVTTEAVAGFGGVGNNTTLGNHRRRFFKVASIQVQDSIVACSALSLSSTALAPAARSSATLLASAGSPSARIWAAR